MIRTAERFSEVPNAKWRFMKLVHLFIFFASLLIQAESANAACASSPHSTSLVSFALSSDAKKIAAASADGAVVLWDTKSGSRAELVSCHATPISTMVFSADSSMLAFGDTQGVTSVWNLYGYSLASQHGR